jgi:hypothetical protein
MGYAFTSGLQITVNSIHRKKHLGICLPTVGSQTWVRSGWEIFRPSGESNPRPWRWIKSARDQHVKCYERRTRPTPGSTPFHSCVGVRSPKLVSSGDRTGARAPSPSYCSTEGVAPLQIHTAPPVPVILVEHYMHISRLEVQRWPLEFFYFLFSSIYLGFGTEVWLIPFGIM